MKILFLFCFFMFSFLTHATSISLVGNTLYSQPVSAASSTTSYTGKFNFGGGLIVSQKLISIFGVELGGLFLQRSTRVLVTDTRGPIIFSVEGILKQYYFLFPALAQVYVLPNLALGFGGFATKSVGRMKTENFKGTVGTTPVTVTPSTTQAQSTELGLLGGIQATFPIKPKISAHFELWYLRALSRAFTHGNARNRDIQTLVGLSYQL